MSIQQTPNLYLLAVVIGAAYPCGALAQITTDGTLGPAGTLVGPNYAVTANLGRQVGANLFHSFSAFNLTRLESATFSGPASIAHIINRVTGGTASSIDGLLRSTIAGANLYLINPNGILFGQNASLDLTGSFYASTASYLKLADGGRFDATNAAPSVFTSAPPAAFGFLGPTPAPVTVQGSSLSVPEGKNLSLVGGAVNLSDATLRTVAGDMRLIAMTGAGEVSLNATGTSLAGMTLAPITIERSALVTESGSGTAPGRIVIRGGQVTVLDSNITSTNWDSVVAPPIEIAAAGDLAVSASNIVGWAVGAGHGADLVLTGKNVTVDHNAQVYTETYSTGAGGGIELTAVESVRVNAAQEDPNYTNVYTFAYSDGAAGPISLSGDTVIVKSGNVYSGTGSSANSGSVLLQGREVSVINGGFVFAYTGASGNSGNVNILASERSFTAGADWSDPPFQTSIFTYTQGTGRAGNVTINAPEITMRGGDITSTTYSAGDAGSIRLNADVISISGEKGIRPNIESAASNFTTGNGGNVEIRATREFEMSRGDIVPWEWARIAATVQGSGRGGDIIIEAPKIVLDDAALFSRTRFGTGDQGGIIVRADELRLQNFGRIVSVTEGERRGSFILIQAKDVRLSDNSIVAADTSGSGDAGQVTINAQRLKMTGASSIKVNSGTSSGNAGDIVLNIGESLEISERGVFLTNPIFSAPFLDWPGGLRSQAEGTGNAGSIVVRAPNILLDDGRILSTALQSGQGGRVEIHADNLIMRNGAQVDARSAAGSSGNAGSIDIAVAGRFEISGLSPIDGAFSGLYAQTQGSGRGGNIGVGADTLVLDRGLIRSSTGGSGNAGTIRIRAGDVVLANGGWIDTGTTAGSSGAGGSIDVAATRSLVVGGIDRSPLTRSLMETQQLDITPGTSGRVQGPFASTISSNTDGAGTGGNVTLNAPQISVLDGASVSASSTGTGNAGNILLQAQDWFKLSGGSITTQAEISNGGNITLNAPQITIDADGQVSANSSGPGSAGNILIDAPQRLNLSGGAITTQAAMGAGGDVTLHASQITIDGGAQLSASSSGAGNAGNIFVEAPDWLKLSGGSITTQAEISNGGNISLSSPQITIEDRGRVSANSSGAGNAGNILIRAPDWLKLTDGLITTQALSGDGGNIVILAGNRVHLRNAEISTSVGSGEGSGGNIFIDPTFVILENSRIVANAFGGAGGNINIVADFFLASPDSVIDASSQLGVSGSVQIAAPRTDPSATLALLPATLFDASSMLRESCAGRAGPRASSLVGVGRGGLAAAPDGNSTSRYFADTLLPLARVDNPAKFARSRADAAAALSVLLAACTH